MDEYTETTRKWLDERFKSVDAEGVYQSHAPIYGFAGDLLSLGLYKNNYAILRTIGELLRVCEIRTFLEVGCAEGFTANLVRNIFGFKTVVSDISREAVKRAGEIYGLEGFEADAQSLDRIKDGSFDLVLCSETIEHVPFPEKAFAGLFRIAKKALIITVPAAKDMDEKRKYIPTPGPHAHLHIFTREELAGIPQLAAAESGPGGPSCGGRIESISNRRLSGVESLFTKNVPSGPAPARATGGVLARSLGKFYGIGMAKLFIRLDRLLCRVFPAAAHTYMAVFRKAPAENRGRPRENKRILDHMLRENKADAVRIVG